MGGSYIPPSIFFETICIETMEFGDLNDTHTGKTQRGNLRFKCAKGHIFTASYSHIQQGSWCHACRTGQRSIGDMHELAEQYGGKCLSTEYINNRTKLKWKCKRGHVFWKAYNKIQSRDVFCYLCN